MANETKKKNKDVKRITKPYEKGSIFSGRAVALGLKLLGYQCLFIFIYLFVGSMLIFESNAILRIVTNLGLVFICGGILYMDGARKGETDVAFAEIAYKRKSEGKSLTDKDLAKCFHPFKAKVIVAVGVSLLVLVSAIYALSAQKEVYQLQTLPEWVASYATQQDVSLPLSYYFGQEYQMTAMDVIKGFVRASIYPYINIATVDNPDLRLVMDRLSPLLVILPFLFYEIGYLQGPKVRAQIHGSIASNNQRYKRKQKKQRKQRVTRKNEPEQLV